MGGKGYIFFLLLFFCTPAFSQLATVSAQYQPDQEIRDVLAPLNPRYFDFQKHPELIPTMDKTVEMVQQMVIAEDGPEPIHVVFVENTHVNAMFLKHEKKKYLVVHTGTYNFVQADDELAHVLGHEMEHGISQLDEAIKELSRQSVIEWVIRSQLEKARESEMDIKSIIRRVQKAGKNPHAARDWVLRMIELYGSRPSQSHPTNTTRLNVVDIGLTGIRRGLGDLTDPKLRTHDIHSEAKQFLQSDAYRDERRAEIDRIIAEEPEGIRELMVKIRDKQLSAKDLSRLREEAYYGPLAKLFVKDTSQIFALSNGMYNESQLLDLQLKLARNYSDHFERLRTEVLGDGFLPQTTSQFEALYILGKRNFGHIFLGYGQSFSCMQNELELREMQKKLNILEADFTQGLVTQERVVANRKAIGAVIDHHVKRREYLLSAFQNQIYAQQLVMKLTDEWEAKCTGGGCTIPKEIFDLNEQLFRNLKHVGDIHATVDEQQNKLAVEVLARLELDYENPESFRTTQAAYEDLPLGERKALLPQIFKNLNNAFERIISRERDPKKKEELIRVHTNVCTDLTAGWRHRQGLIDSSNIEAVKHELRRLTLMAADNAPNIETLSAFLPKQGKNPRQKYDNGVFNTYREVHYQGSVIQIAPGKVTEVVDREMIENHVSNLNRLLSEGMEKVENLSDAFKLLDMYLYQLSSLRDLTANTSLFDKDLLDGLMGRALEVFEHVAIGRLKLPETSSVTAEQLWALFLAKYHDLASFVPENRSMAAERISEILTEMFQRNVPDPLRRRVSFFNLLALRDVAPSGVFNLDASQWDQLMQQGLPRSATHVDLNACRMFERLVLGLIASGEDLSIRLASRLADHGNYAPLDNNDSVDKFFRELDLKVIYHTYLDYIARVRKGSLTMRKALRQWLELNQYRWYHNYIMNVFDEDTFRKKFLSEQEAMSFVLDLYFASVGFARKRLNQGTYDKVKYDHHLGAARHEAQDLFQVVLETFNIADRLDEFRAEWLAGILSQSARFAKSSSERNAIFEYVWERRNINEGVRRALRNPLLVHSLGYDDQKIKLSEWQLDQILGIEKMGKDLRDEKVDPPGVKEVRPVIERM